MSSTVSYLVAGFLLACLGLAGTYAYDLGRQTDTTRDLVVGRSYRIGRRRVRCLALGDDRWPFRAVTWLDEATGERATVTYTHTAEFPRAWWWSR